MREADAGLFSLIFQLVFLRGRTAVDLFEFDQRCKTDQCKSLDNSLTSVWLSRDRRGQSEENREREREREREEKNSDARSLTGPLVRRSGLLARMTMEVKGENGGNERREKAQEILGHYTIADGKP